MKRPSFQFYPADWRNNGKLRRCSFGERGVWLEVMCLMHDSDEYGVLRWPIDEIAQAVGCAVAELQRLVEKGVMKGARSGEKCAPYVYTPRSGRRNGEAVTLIEECDGPIWYSSRMVVDEHRRTVRAEAGGTSAPKPPFGEAIGDSPKGSPYPSPLRARASSSSSPSGEGQKQAAGAPVSDLWGPCVKVLTDGGSSIETARSFIGKQLKTWPADTVRDAIFEGAGTPEPKAYITKILQSKPRKVVAPDPFAGAR